MVTEEWHRSVAHHDESYVGGRWTALTGEHRLAVIDPSTGILVATVCESSEDDIDAAVAAAQTACPELAKVSPSERAMMLLALANEIEKRQVQFATTISLEMGAPIALCAQLQVAPAVARLRRTAAALAGSASGHDGSMQRGFLAPVGVVGAITSWDTPLRQIVDVLAPALAAGCPVVLKPSETTPLDVFLLAEAVEAAGLRSGCLGVIQGTGRHVGEALVRHPGVQLISFAGSYDAGKRVSQVASHSFKPVRIELRQSSVGLVKDDADVGAAVAHCVRTLAPTCGQGGDAVRVLLVPFEQVAEAEAAVVEQLGRCRAGAALDPATEIGPLANANQYERARRSRERAVLDGAREVWSLPEAVLPEGGFFIPPAVFTVVDSSPTSTREGVVGPVVSLVPYLDQADSLTRMNERTGYQRAALWTADEASGLAMARQIGVPLVDVHLPPATPGTKVPTAAPALSDNVMTDEILSFTTTRRIRVLRENA
jgi:aldehyde dehydrogenase (NAD+)